MLNIISEVAVALIIAIPLASLMLIAYWLREITQALRKQNEMYRLVHASYLRGMEEE